MDFTDKEIERMDLESQILFEKIDKVISNYVEKWSEDEESGISFIIMSAIANVITKLICIMEVDRENVFDLLNDMIPDNKGLNQIRKDNERRGQVIPLPRNPRLH